MNCKTANKFIMTVLIAVLVMLVMSASAFAWGEVYADQKAEGTNQTPVFGIYTLITEDGDIYFEWFGEEVLPEGAQLILEFRDEMTDSESEEYRSILERLTADQSETGNQSNSMDGTGLDEETGAIEQKDPEDPGRGTGLFKSPGVSDPTEFDDPDNTENNDIDGIDPPDEDLEKDSSEDEDLEKVENPDPATDPVTDPTTAEDQDPDKKTEDMQPQMQTKAPPADDQSQQAERGETRDTVPTGIFTGSRLGLIMMIIIVALAAVVMIRRSRRLQSSDPDLI